MHTSLADLVRLRHKARGFSFLPRQPVHSVLAGRHSSRLRGRGLNFEELRNYLPGDDIRNIDWKVTARTRAPHVRVYTEERDRSVWLLVDQRISMQFGSQRCMKAVTAAEVAALAAWRVLEVGDRVGGVVFSDEGEDVVLPHRSEDRVMQLLGHITRRNQALDALDAPTPGPGALNHALLQVGRMAPHDCLLVLITDGLGIDQETRRLISRITQHNDVICALVHDPMEAALPDAGRLTFSDGKGRIETNTGSARLRARFQDDFENRLEQLRSASRRYKIPVLPIHTGAEAAGQIRNLLGRQQAPSRR